MRRRETNPLAFFLIIDGFFSLAFGVDLVLRLIGERAGFFFSSDRVWNYMDFGLVVGDVFNELINAIMGAIGSSAPSANFDGLRGAARACRAIRMARTLRVFRSVSLFALPREVVASFATVPLMILIWFFIALFFSLIFMQASAESLASESTTESNQNVMYSYFGSVGNSLLSLFYVLLGAMDWDILYDAIAETSGLYAFMFLSFAFFAIVAFYNSITAMCVQGCLARVQRNELDTKSTESVKLAAVLSKTDKGSNCNWGQLNQNLDDPMVHGHLDRLGLDISDARGLCKLMSRGDKQPVNMGEFARACVKFTRTVRGVDFLPVLLANKRILQEVRDLADRFPSSPKSPVRPTRFV